MEKIHISAVEKNIINCILETFDTMVAMPLTKADTTTDPGLNDRRLVAAVHFAGEADGVLSLHVSQEFATLITTAMLGIEASQIDSDEEIKDVLGELANIISGSLRSEFQDDDLACVISTPLITRGTDFKIPPGRRADRRKWIFRFREHELLVAIDLQEELGARSEIARIGRLDSVEVQARIHSVDLSATVIDGVIDGFKTLLAVKTAHVLQTPPGFREDKRTAGTVSFAGDVQGSLNIQVNDGFIRTVLASKPGPRAREVKNEEEIFDVLRELSHLIGASIKSAFVEVGLSCVISTPTITTGRDFNVEPLDIIKARRFFFSCGGHTVIVDACIKTDDADEARSPDTRPAEQTHAIQDQAEAELRNLRLIMEIPIELTVELGRASRCINEVLKMDQGTVVELDQLEGEPVDLLVNETLIAKGEVVVEREKYGIRIVEVVSRKERVESLR